eukprot:s153_g25.t1
MQVNHDVSAPSQNRIVPSPFVPLVFSSLASHNLLQAALVGDFTANDQNDTTGPDPDLTRILLNARAEENLIDDSGITPLILATTMDYPVGIRFLINRTADPNMPDQLYEEAPLHYAIQHNGEECVRALLDGRANPLFSSETSEQLTPRELAEFRFRLTLRQLALSLRPSNNNRGLALMGALTNWPAFNMQQLLQSQILRLEEALEEARQAGSTVPDQLQQAIRLKCVTGQLQTHLNMATQKSTTFKELREQILRWDRSQQKWNSLIFADKTSTSTPMQVDRVYSDGRGWSGRVARIQFSEVGSHVSKHDELVFDLRSSVNDACAYDGTVRVVRFYIGDEPNDSGVAVSDACDDSCGFVRTMLEEIPEESCMRNILLDSGADASVFPASMAEFGSVSNAAQTCLRDAQGENIPLHGMRDIELRLADMQGRTVVIKETVALSDRINQLILCFGKLMESGWNSNSREQTMTHDSGIAIPLELQNRSVCLRGWIRMLRSEPEILGPLDIRAIRADVMSELSDLRVGWNLTPEGIGKHFGSCFQDPTVACPTMAGSRYRTTLIEEDNQWFVLELCEPKDSLIDLSAEFYGYGGGRYIITIVTKSEKPPQVMGFRLLDDGDMPLAEIAAEREQEVDPAPMAPEDEVYGVEIDVEQQDEIQGQDVPQGHVVLAPERGDQLNINEERCFQRLWEYQKRLELQTALAAARETEAAQRREPVPQHLAEAPDEKEQLKHMLAHLPYANWCPHCVAHRACADRHMRDGSVKDSGIPTVSFDFAYIKAVGPGGNVQDTDSVAALVLVDSSTNFAGCVPIATKHDLDLMIREILQFTQIMGNSECNYLCDNEPSILQVQKRAVNARTAMGLVTHSKTPAAYTHGNSLCENIVRRVRELAGTLMHHVQEKLSMSLNSDHGLWSWALRHASWLLIRFAVVHGSTPYELVYQKIYKGRMAEFAEPAFACVRTALKGNPKWQRVLVLGKTEAQDTYIVFTGQSIMLTRSVRRIATDWKCHLGFYLHFNSPTWRSKTGFGGRIIPAKRSIGGESASFKPPDAPVLPHPLHDADGEAVRKKMIEEKGEERETAAMGEEDQNVKDAEVKRDEGLSSGAVDVDQPSASASSSLPSVPRRPGEVVVDSVFDDDVMDASQLPAMEEQVDLTFEGGMSAPVTPPMSSPAVPPTPRQQHGTRVHDEELEVDHDAKKARVEAQKKQKITQLREAHEAMIQTVRIGSDEFATMDSYETEPNVDEDLHEDELWSGEDQLQFDGEIPEALWSDLPVDRPPGPPEPWVDKLANELEISRLLKMEVLQKVENPEDDVENTLTTRFVYDWRAKMHKSGQMKWMRRSRFAAREFASTRRHDTYSPATGSHTSNLIPLVFLKMLGERFESGCTDEQYSVIMSSLDIKDAFLQVPQEKAVGVSLYQQRYIIKKNLPGQRLGARAWYWYFREYVVCRTALPCTLY